jgi:hypothetical protein
MPFGHAGRRIIAAEVAAWAMLAAHTGDEEDHHHNEDDKRSYR